MKKSAAPCEHFGEIRPVKARTEGCEECIALGATWNELRVCLSCGHVGCCEDSQHAHAFHHFKTTAHPIIGSYERGESWLWCYVDRSYYDPPPGSVPKRRSAFSAFLARLLRRKSH